MHGDAAAGGNDSATDTSATDTDGTEVAAERAARFLALHRPGEPLLLPNPWDAGSARVLASLGFAALATTSSGFAATLRPARRRREPGRGPGQRGRHRDRDRPAGLGRPGERVSPTSPTGSRTP